MTSPNRPYFMNTNGVHYLAMQIRETYATDDPPNTLARGEWSTLYRHPLIPNSQYLIRITVIGMLLRTIYICPFYPKL